MSGVSSGIASSASLEHRGIVGADRTDIGAAPATGNDAGAAQDTLPEIEAVLGANQVLLLPGVRLGDDAGDVLAELGKAVRANGSGRRPANRGPNVRPRRPGRS